MLRRLGIVLALACACSKHDEPRPAPSAPPAVLPATLPVHCDELLPPAEVMRACGVAAELAPESPRDDLGGDRTCMRELRSATGGHLAVAATLLPTAAEARNILDLPHAGAEPFDSIGDGARRYRDVVAGEPAPTVEVVRGRIEVRIWEFEALAPPCSPEGLVDVARGVAARLPLLRDDAHAPGPARIPAPVDAAPGEVRTTRTLLDCKTLVSAAELGGACHAKVTFPPVEAGIPTKIEAVMSGDRFVAYDAPACDIFFDSGHGGGDLFIAGPGFGSEPDGGPAADPDHPEDLVATAHGAAGYSFKLTIEKRWCDAAGMRKLVQLVKTRLPAK